jgi:hypothetical protein
MNDTNLNDTKALSAKSAVLERLRAIYGEDAQIIKQGQMYATSAPATHVGTTPPVETWVFEAEIGEGSKTMTLVATQSGHGWSIRKITSTHDDPARDL